VLLLFAFVAELVFFSGSYSGDGLIHIVFAQNAVDGHWLQFNPGEYTGGETSMGFMLFAAGLVALFGKGGAIIGIKLASLAALVGIAWLGRRLAIALGAAPMVATICALSAAAMPGTVLNGQSGSENVFFAVGVLAWFAHAVALRWMAPDETPLRRELILGLAAGALVWIRPEAIPFFGLAFGLRFFLRWQDRGLAGSFRDAIAIGLPFVLLILVYVGSYFAITGLIPFTAGGVRAEASKMRFSIEIFGLRYSYLTLLRSFIYFPVPILTALAGWRCFRRRNEVGEPGRAAAHRFGLLLALTFFVFLALFGSVLPTIHTARYTIFLWPLAAVVIALDQRSWPPIVLQRPIAISKQRAGAIMLLVFLCVGAVEFSFRSPWANKRFFELARSGGQSKVEQVMRETGHPTKRPVVLGVVEVQIRNFLDDRFVVRSLDGIVDTALGPYFCGDFVDHIGYILERGIDFLGDFPQINRDKNLFSLKYLDGLSPGQRIRRGGMMFTRLENWVAVEIDDDYYARRPHVRCDRRLYEKRVRVLDPI